jgi:hypothetical protein
MRVEKQTCNDNSQASPMHQHIYILEQYVARDGNLDGRKERLFLFNMTFSI